MTDFWDPHDWDEGPYFYNSQLIHNHEIIESKKMAKSELVKFWEESFGIKLWQFMLLGVLLSGVALVGVLFLVKWIFNL